MTSDELQALSGQRFDYIVMYDDGSVMFAVPIPGHPELEYKIRPNGGFHLEAPADMAETVLEYWLDAWDEYASGLPKLPQRHYRVRRQYPEEGGAIVITSKALALPSRYPYERAFSTIANQAAYLQPILPKLAAGLRFENGTLYFKKVKASKIDLVKFYDNGKEAVSKIDLPLLLALYTICLQEAENRMENLDSIEAMNGYLDRIDRSVTIRMPELLRMMGYSPNGNKKQEDIILAKIMGFADILGVMKDPQGNGMRCSYYPVMKLLDREESENSISIASPYINEVIRRILLDGIQKDEKGNPKLKRNGKPLTYASNCFLVKSSIVKSKNRRAVEIVCALAVLVAQAGSNGKPNIRTKKLIERCPDLKNALEAAPNAKRRNTILERAFAGAYDLLETQTTIKEKYKEVEFPTAIPTTKSLREGRSGEKDDGRVIRIKHKGRKMDGEEAG